MGHRYGGGRTKHCGGIEACEIVDFLAGEGLTVDEDTCALSVTTHDVFPSPDETLSFTVMTDSSLSLDAKTLTLQKTYTTYNILRSYHGQFLGIETGNVIVQSDVITLPDVYGYGSVDAQMVQERKSTQGKPNFYSKEK